MTAPARAPAAGPIHIACQSSEELAPDCGVMLRSLLSTNPGERFVIHYLHGDSVGPETRARLEGVVTDLGARWEPIRITDRLITGFPVLERYGGSIVWFRLLLPRLLPELERVLYLDADLLVLEPVRPLWEIDLAGRCLAAVTQPLLRRERQRVVRDLGVPDAGRYFNTGVMVMDLGRLRSSGLMQAAERVPRERRVPIPWVDQDALNVTLWAERLDLHPRWNVMNPCFELPARYLPWPRREVEEATARPAIVHFIGPYKPWHYRLRHPYAAQWFAHLEKTPWHGRPQEGRSTRHTLLKALPPPVALGYEITEYAVQRGVAASGRVARQGAKRALAGHPGVSAAARASLRLLRPGSAPDPLTDVLDAFADCVGEACFVQIGAGDAEYGDPLRRYVLSRAWRGVMVEPVPYMFERLSLTYAQEERITLVNAAIAVHDGEIPFYYLAESDDTDLPEWYDKLGSLSRENLLHPYHVENIPDVAGRIVSEPVRAMTFESLWREHPLPRFDLLLIDAEGFDDEILAQVDLTRHRPTIVIYERQHLSESRRTEVADGLRRHGYVVLALGPDALAVSRNAPLPVRLAARRQRRLTEAAAPAA